MCKDSDSKCDGNCECKNDKTASGDNCSGVCSCENEQHTVLASDLVELRKEQDTVYCMLDHSGDPRGTGPYEACATMILQKDERQAVPIHVCDVCAVSLLDVKSDWYIFICFGCLRTKWLHENDLKQSCDKQIQVTNKCFDCENVFDN